MWFAFGGGRFNIYKLQHSKKIKSKQFNIPGVSLSVPDVVTASLSSSVFSNDIVILIPLSSSLNYKIQCLIV